MATKPLKIQVILAAPSNPCQLASLNVAISQEDSRERLAQIIRLMSTGPPEVQLQPNFEANELTAVKVKRLFRLLDLYFYNRTLLPTIKSKKVKIFFNVFPFNQETFQPCLKLLAINSDQNKLLELHFMINLNRFQHSAQYRITNGIKVRNKAEALAISALHEITHALLYVFCPDKQGHTATFLDINHKLHGGDPAIFEYRDEVPPVATGVAG